MDGFLDPHLRAQRLELAYPCRWSFKIIGEDEFQLRTLVNEVLPDRPFTLTLSNTSREGRYRSLLLVLTVESEEDRRAIGLALQQSEHVRLVF